MSSQKTLHVLESVVNYLKTFTTRETNMLDSEAQLHSPHFLWLCASGEHEFGKYRYSVL